MSLVAAIVGFVKSPAAPLMGVTGIALGLAASDLSWLASPIGVGGGVALLILAWFANSVRRVMERWLDAQGQKLIDLPTAAALSEDKRSLTDALDDFSRAADREREAMGRFRETLAATLADHGARIRNLEIAGGK